MFIQLQLENQRLRQEVDIINTALINACQAICRELNFSQESVIRLRNKYVEKVRDVYDYE